MKALIWVLSCIVIIFAMFYTLNTYIDTEKQGEVSQFRDGKYLGFIHALTDNGTRMDFDDATWLTGVAGQDAAIRAGICTEETRDECLPNDYFIENTVVEDAGLSIDPSIRVFMQTYQMEETGQVATREINLNDLATLINDPKAHWSTLPYTITVANNAVVRIEEVYVP